MKAVYIEAHGDVGVLQYGDRPDPAPGPSDVVVRVGASALNRLDIFTREGQRGLEREFPPPLILGGDTAGEVVAVGDGREHAGRRRPRGGQSQTGLRSVPVVRLG